MHLFLCGGGCGKQVYTAMNKFCEIVDDSKPLLYIPLAMDSSKYDSCAQWFSREIEYFGLKNFEMVRSSKELSEKNFDNYGAIFIGGGNTYKLLNELKTFDNFGKITKYLNNNGVVFGGSAGAIIFGKNINACLLDDGNIVGLEDLSGFNLLNDCSLLCHLKEKNLKINKNYLKEFSEKNKLIYLPEEDVIYINDNEIQLLGDKEYLFINNGVFETISNKKIKTE